MIVRLLIVIWVFAAATLSQVPAIESGVLHDLAKWRAARYSDVRYKLNLTLEKMSPVLKGTMEIRVKVGDGAVSEPGAVATGFMPPIILDWRKIAGHEKDSTISNVTINGTSIDIYGNEAYHLDVIVHPYVIADREHLIFSKGVKRGDNVIKLDFTSPILTSGSAITRYVDKEDGAEYIYSLFVPSDASTAFPVFDQPDLKARFSLFVTHPKEWEVISNASRYQVLIADCFNAALSSRCPNSSVFYETKPISSYVFAFTAGPWVGRTARENVVTSPNSVWSTPSQIGGSITPREVVTLPRDLKNPDPGRSDGSGPFFYVRASQAKKFEPHLEEVFRLNREGIKYLETYFDYKFPFPKYDLVLIPEFPFGGMEHAGATFLRESSVIFPTEPTKSDYISRANLIFHETAHQWFGDTVTMKWFDDLWLKEGFAEFMAYKTLEKVMPDANAWKVFYERNKQAAYLTDSTKGTTPIYQPIANLSAAKSAYGNIVYRKAPSFLRQAEFYLGEDKFQTAVRAFLKKHEFANAGWEDLVREFETASGNDIALKKIRIGIAEGKEWRTWGSTWVSRPGLPIIRSSSETVVNPSVLGIDPKYKNVQMVRFVPSEKNTDPEIRRLPLKFKTLVRFADGTQDVLDNELLMFQGPVSDADAARLTLLYDKPKITFVFPNYQDYGYGIFLLDDKSRDYVLKNIQNEKDPFLRSMMWGSLWDSVREGELDPREYVELVIKNLPTEQDETIVSSILGRVGTAMNYYLSKPSASAGGQKRNQASTNWPPADAGGSDLNTRLEAVLVDNLQHAPTAGQRITFYRAFVTNASTERSRTVLKQMLAQAGQLAAQPMRAGSPRSDVAFTLRTKDKFDIVTRLAILGDPEAPKLLANLEKTETGDDAKRYAYAARAGIATPENKAKYWNDFTANKDISESWIEAAFGPFNSIRHSDLTLPYLERALKELPNHKRNRKIFFVNGWLGSFIGGQRSEAALAIVNKFLAEKPNLDYDLRLKILENVDLIERAVKIRSRFPK